MFDFFEDVRMRTSVLDYIWTKLLSSLAERKEKQKLSFAIIEFAEA